MFESEASKFLSVFIQSQVFELSQISYVPALTDLSYQLHCPGHISRRYHSKDHRDLVISYVQDKTTFGWLPALVFDVKSPGHVLFKLFAGFAEI